MQGDRGEKAWMPPIQTIVYNLDTCLPQPQKRFPHRYHSLYPYCFSVVGCDESYVIAIALHSVQMGSAVARVP